MGIEKDYLMRQLLMLFEVIQKIFRYRKRGDTEKAQDEIKYFYECLKFETNIESMSIEQIVNYLESKMFTNEHIEMIAFVLKEQGELENNEIKRIDYFQKSHFLLNKVDHESTSFSMDRQMKIAQLKEYLN